MDRWERLRARLATVDSRVRLSWDELEELAGALPASATKYGAWWSGDRPHVRAWRDAGFTLGTLAPGMFVDFVRSAGAPPVRGPDASAPVGQGASDAVVAAPVDTDLLLVSCVKTKREVPAAAKDLYISALFAKQRRYAEQRGMPWFILSARYGLLAPEEWIEPYELYLPKTPASYRASWATRVADRLAELAGTLCGATVEIHAGRTYVDAITPPLSSLGAVLVNPLAGLGSGQRLHWYDTCAQSPDRGQRLETGLGPQR